MLSVLCALVLDPTNGMWARAQAEWGLVHWALAARWAYAFAIAAWGGALGGLAAWRGNDRAVGLVRWGALIGMVTAGGFVAGLAVLVFPPRMPSNGTGAGALVGLALDFVSIVLFVALHCGLVLFGGGLALGVGRLVRAVADARPPQQATTFAFIASGVVLLLAGGVSPASLGAPVAVAGCVVLAGVAASSGRTYRADYAVAVGGVLAAVLFAFQTVPALRWEHDRVRRLSVARCYPSDGSDPSARLAHVPGVLSAVTLQSSGPASEPQHPVFSFLAQADTDPAAVLAAIRAAFPRCTVESAFNPTEVDPEILPAILTPLAFHYLLVDDEDDAPRRVIALEALLRDALTPRRGSKLLVEGYGDEPRFVLPKNPEGALYVNVCSPASSGSPDECRTDTDVELGRGHAPAFGSVDVETLGAMKGNDWPPGGTNALLEDLADADTERARVLRARYHGIQAFLDFQPDNDTVKEIQCDSLEAAIDQLPPRSSDAETLYWTGREARGCASAKSIPAEQAARMRKKGASLLARVPASSGIWASRAEAARATFAPATGGAELARVQAALDRIPASDATDPLVELETLAGYACPAKDAAGVTRLVAGLRAASSASKGWLPGAVARRAEKLEKCATPP